MRLRSQQIRVNAPRDLVFDVIAAAGKELAGTEAEHLVEFETKWRGRTLKTVEAVTLDRPRRITYRWVMGPLVGVREEIVLDDLGANMTRLRYHGSFEGSGSVLGWLREATVVRSIFNKLVRSHLEVAKQLSEARALRSRVYPVHR